MAAFVTIIMSVVISLTFLFGFGNVLHLALDLHVPVYVAPLVAPAVDLSVLGLLIGTRHLALTGAPDKAIRPARRLLLGTSALALVLNVAEPVSVHAWGAAAFDAVGPLLLIGWAEVGPGLLRALATARAPSPAPQLQRPPVPPATLAREEDRPTPSPPAAPDRHTAAPSPVAPTTSRPKAVAVQARPRTGVTEERLRLARQADAEYRSAHQGKRITRDELRKQLGIGSAPAGEVHQALQDEQAATQADLAS